MMTNSRMDRTLVMFLLWVGMMSGTAKADLSLWMPASGDWSEPTNWSGGFVPGTEGTAPIIGAVMNSGEATIDSSVPTVDEVWVGNATMPGTVNVVSGGDISATNVGETGIIIVGRTFSVLGAHSGSRFNVSGGTVLADGIEVGQVFQGDASTDAQMVISGDGVVTIKNFLRVGHGDSGATTGGEGILTVRENGQLIHDGTGTLPFINDFIAFGFNGGEGGAAGGVGGNSGTLNLEGNAIFDSKRPVRFGWVEEGHGFLNIGDDAQLIIDSGEMSPAAIMFGDFNNSAVGTGQNRPIGMATQTGGTVTVGTDTARPQWTAIGGSGYGEYNMSGGKLNIFVRDGLNIGDTDQNDHPGEGVFNLTDGTVNATEITVGKIGRATGVFTQSGGTVNVGIVTPDGNFVDRIDTTGAQLMLDPNYDGKLTLGGGFGAASTATGTYDLSNGTLHALGINVGFLGNGTFTQSGGTVTADIGVIVAFGTNDVGVPSTGILNLNGGVFETAAIGGGGGGNSTVNFNGGTVRATVDQPLFIVNLTTANVQAGGLIIDSNGFDVESNAQFSGVGGHIKRGGGTSTLTGNNTYAGTTTVEAGTLLVNGSHTGGGAYTVNVGATLGGTGTIGSNVNVNGAAAPGESIGTLTVNGTVSFGSDGIFDVEIDADGNVSDLLAVNGDLNLSGLNDMLQLSLFAGSLPVTGPLTIATYTGALTGIFNLDNGDFTIDYGTGSNSSISISNITFIEGLAGLAGDYNNNGVVDAADYTQWRDHLGDPTEAGINNNGDGGGVGLSDYTYWAERFGNTAAGRGSGGLDQSHVPEPAAIVFAMVAILGLFVVRRRRHAAA